MIKTTGLELIENDMESLKMNLVNDSWRAFVPSDPGGYSIQTNTPPDIFKGVNPPQGERQNDIYRFGI